jgi:RNA polymerase sigma factor (sigma-70 family)
MSELTAAKQTGMNSREQATSHDPGLAAAEPGLVHIVDDDLSIRIALTRLLRSRGYETLDFGSSESFLEARDAETHGCILVDVAMPGLGGLGLQRKLLADGDAMPIIFLTAAADVQTCAAAMRLGALDFMMKPVDEEELVRAIDMGLRHDTMRRMARAHRDEVEARLATLTPREREVLEHVMNGRLNKQIAADLGTAEKTIKVHRARAMEKMHARSVAELVREVERARGSGSRSG